MTDPKDSIRFTMPNGDPRLFLDEEIYEGVFSLKEEIKRMNYNYSSLDDIDHKNGISLFELIFVDDNEPNQYFVAFDNRQDNPW